MKIRYFHDTDTLYIEFRQALVAETRDLDENTQNNLDQILIGTGPYVFKEFKGQYIEMEKYENYLIIYPACNTIIVEC